MEEAHQDVLPEILGNLASDGDPSYIEIIHYTTDIIFPKCDAKYALNTTLSQQSQSILLKSLHMPDWIYVLLKVRMKISDAEW